MLANPEMKSDGQPRFKLSYSCIGMSIVHTLVGQTADLDATSHLFEGEVTGAGVDKSLSLGV